jgi:phosphatidylglycerophosphatase A
VRCVGLGSSFDAGLRRGQVWQVKKRILEALATGFYLGKIPKAPGTFGTLLGIPCAWAMATYLPPVWYLIGTVIFVLAACVVAEMYERLWVVHDPKEIVIDEVVGYVIAMTWLPLTWQSFLYAFIAFRFFDILKPGPIRRIDQKVKGGLGTVLDDVAAGLVASVILQVILSKTNWLGGAGYAL